MDRQSIETIKLFALSLADFFKTMLGCEPKLVSQQEKKFKELGDRRVISVIGLSGDVRGTVAISMPVATALAMVGKFIGMDMKELDEMVVDAVAEMGNIIAGGAKTRLQSRGKIELSLPNVVICRGSMIFYSPSHSQRVNIGFTSPLGDFEMLVTLEKAAG